MKERTKERKENERKKERTNECKKIENEKEKKS
jgi:hypothetical protein